MNRSSRIRAPWVLVAGALYVLTLLPDTFLSGIRSRIKLYLEERLDAMHSLGSAIDPGDAL